MAKNKTPKTVVPENFATLEEAAKFWDTHSLADYEDIQQDVDFEVVLRSDRNYFAIEKTLSKKIDELARMQGVLPETLVNVWLEEKVHELLKTA